MQCLFNLTATPQKKFKPTDGKGIYVFYLFFHKVPPSLSSCNQRDHYSMGEIETALPHCWTWSMVYFCRVGHFGPWIWERIQRDADIWEREWTSEKTLMFWAPMTIVPVGAMWSLFQRGYDRPKIFMSSLPASTLLLDVASIPKPFCRAVTLRPQKFRKIQHGC